MTVASLTAELNEARGVALANKQAGTAVQATATKSTGAAPFLGWWGRGVVGTTHRKRRARPQKPHLIIREPHPGQGPGAPDGQARNSRSPQGFSLFATSRTDATGSFRLFATSPGLMPEDMAEWMTERW